MSKVDKQPVLNSSVEMIRNYYEKEHKHNKDRIKYGIIAMIIIPIVFLILLFAVKSSKVVFLVMWIASLFIISGYLIAIEYKDYNMSENLKDIIGEDKNDTLIDTTKILSDIAKNYADNDDAKTSQTDINDNNYIHDNNSENIKNNNKNNNNGYVNDIPVMNNIPVNITKADTTDAALTNTDHIVNNAGNIDCQNITIDNKVNANTITISIDNKTNAINITINPNKEAAQ